MSRVACLRAGIQLERRAAGLTRAEQLELEQHLSACAACQQQAVLLRALPAALTAGADEEIVRSAERALERALGQADAARCGRPLPRPAATRAGWRWPALGLATAVGLLLAGLALRGPRSKAPHPRRRRRRPVLRPAGSSRASSRARRVGSTAPRSRRGPS